MILGDVEIRQLLDAGKLITNGVSPLVNPASLNVRLGDTFLVPNGKVTLGKEVEYTRYKTNQRGCFYIPAGGFALATTIEEIAIPDDLAAFVQGRSSIGRAGLTVQNAGFVDPGFHGHITLELKNELFHGITVQVGYPVAQLVFFRTGTVDHPYAGKYNGQVEATGSRMYMDADND